MVRRSHILTATALLAVCVAPGSALAMPNQPTTPQVSQDLRSPDARDAALQAAERTTQVSQDLRSPDARDAGRVNLPVQTPVVEIREVPSNGFDWGDAGIGAAGLVAMLSIAAGLTLMLASRRRRRGVQTAH